MTFFYVGFFFTYVHFKVHPCDSTNQYSIPFYGYIIFHCEAWGGFEQWRDGVRSPLKENPSGLLWRMNGRRQLGVCENKEEAGWSAWLAESIDHVILDLKVMSLSPILGVEPTLKKKKKKEEAGALVQRPKWGQWMYLRDVGVSSDILRQGEKEKMLLTCVLYRLELSLPE